MAIQTETLPSWLIRTFSDRGVLILQSGTEIAYAEAIDPPESSRTYTETMTPIQVADP
jgi:hypothetical protein